MHEFPLMRDQYALGDLILQVKSDSRFTCQMEGKGTNIGCIKLTRIDWKQGGKIGFPN